MSAKDWLASIFRPAAKDTTLAEPDPWLKEAITGVWRQGNHGQRVSHATALGLSTYFACLRNISEDIAKLPVDVVRSLRPRGREQVFDHPVSTLFNRAFNPEMSAFVGRQTATMHALAYHGAFIEIVRNGAGEPVELWPLDPRGVVVERDVATRRLRYTVTMDTGGVAILPEDSVLHLVGTGFDGVTAYTIARIANDSLGAALAAQNHRGSFFGNGAITNGVLEVPGVLKEDAQKRLREQFRERYESNEGKYRTMVLEQGMAYKPITTDPDKSQMIDSLNYSVEDVCRWFRMNPNKVGHWLRTTFNNVAEANLDHVGDTLMPWALRWEQEIARKMLVGTRNQGLSAKHTFQALLRGDQRARAEYYKSMFGIGAMSVNDIRELEDMPLIEDGDEMFVPVNMVPLSIALEGPPGWRADGDTDGDMDGEGEDSATDTQDARDAAQAKAVLNAHKSIIESAAARLLKVDGNNIASKMRREDFQDWLSAYYDERASVWQKEIEPIATGIAIALGDARCSEWVSQAVSSEVQHLIAQCGLEACADDIDCSKWKDTKAEPFAARVCNAIAKGVQDNA